METRFYEDPSAPVLSDGFADYTPGISEKRSGVSTFYGHDRLGSNNLLETSSSTVSFQASYDAFGLVKSSSGSTASPFGFVGQAGYQTDSNSGLMLLGHRYYDSSTGRFLTRDPIKEGSNWYVYVGNNPLYWYDPFGLNRFWDGVRTFAGHAGVAILTGAIIATLPVTGTGVLIGVGVVAIGIGVDKIIDHENPEAPWWAGDLGTLVGAGAIGIATLPKPPSGYQITNIKYGWGKPVK